MLLIKPYEPGKRPVGMSLPWNCEQCGEPIIVPCAWYRSMDEPHNGKHWVFEGVQGEDYKARLCHNCLEHVLEAKERSRELLSDVPPSWFDPAYAGERWDDNY